MKIRVGTRGSRLALTQTELIIDSLKKLSPELSFEVVVIKTKGDEILHLSLDKIGDKGLFVKEIEKKLLDGDIDMAVHSLKDMPSAQEENLVFSRTPLREDSRDVLILSPPFKNLSSLPIGARIGTGSKRRLFQLMQIRPDIVPVPIRGNVETRIKKIEDENLHGVILAAAGIHRLGLEDKISEYLSHEIMIPAPAQGALALQYHKNSKELGALLDKLTDINSDLCVRAERAFLKSINGGCHIPIGAHATLSSESKEMTLSCIWGNEDGSYLRKITLNGSINDPEALGELCAKAMKS